MIKNTYKHLETLERVIELLGYVEGTKNSNTSREHVVRAAENGEINELLQDMRQLRRDMKDTTQVFSCKCLQEWLKGAENTNNN